jgi:hypothetical protein
MPSWEVNESFGKRQFGDVLRLSRSTDGRRTIWFHPDWRRRQATIYQNAAALHEGDRTFMLPEWEDDELLINYFMFRMYGRCNSAMWTELISMAVELDEYNDYHGMGTRIKAFFTAEWSIDDIGEKLCLDTEVIQTFLGIFFDISSILYNKERVASIVFPFGPELRSKLSPSEQRENLWIAAAFSGEPTLLEFFTQNKFQVSNEEAQKNFETLISMTTAQAMEYGVHMRSEGLPRPVHFQNFLALQEVAARHLTAKAQQDGINNQNKATEQLEKWTRLLSAIGIRRAQGREIQEDAMVTNLSITELRNGNAALPSGKGEDIRRRLVDVKSGVGVQTFDDAD